MMDMEGRLKSSIEALRERFFTLDEYPFISRDRLPMDIIEKAFNIQASDIPDFAAALSSRQIEALLLDYRTLINKKEQQKIAAILAERFSKRLMRLIMEIYQYDYNANSMTTLLETMINAADKLQSHPETGDFIWKFGLSDERYQDIDGYIDANGKELDRFLLDFQIKDDSPLAYEIKYHYLKLCSREVIFLNSRHLMQLINKRTASENFDLILNYLQVFPLEDYLDGINLAIFEKLGDPYISPDWQPYNTKTRDKFAQWKFLYLLKLRSRVYPNKYKVLSQYFHQVRSSYEISEGNIVVLDFGEIVVVDIMDRPYSLFYNKDVFEREMSAWKDHDSEDIFSLENEPSFLKLDKDSVSARDYIIEEMEDNCMRLSYEGVDTLYIAELLDIKMGLEPDMRTGKDKAKKRPRN